MSKRQEAAVRLRGEIVKHAERAQQVFRANVIDTSPLTVELVGSDLQLEVDDDFDLTANMRRYDARYGIDEGETLLLHREGHHYAAFDVLTDKTITSA